MKRYIHGMLLCNNIYIYILYYYIYICIIYNIIYICIWDICMGYIPNMYNIYIYRMNGGCPNSWIIMDSAIKIGNLGVSPF